MKKIILAAFMGILSVSVACTFAGEVKPDLQCTNTCEEDKQDCVTTCKKACVDADGGDPDQACDVDCDTSCGETYDECTLTCTEAE